MAEFDIKIEVTQYHDRNFSITADNEAKAEEIARQLAAEQTEHLQGFLTANAFVFREDLDSIGADDDWRGVHCGSRVFDLNAWDDDGVTRVTAYEVIGGQTDGNIFKRLV